MDMNVLVPNYDESSELRQSPMGGKHQRSLSLSAKWASDKSMAIEYLRRQREVMTWIESVLQRELPSTDLFEALKSGVVLREMMETLFPSASSCMSPISRQYSMRMAPWKERENTSVFLRQCKSIGMNDLSLFCTDDLYEGTNMVQVLFCLQHFMMFSEEHAGHLFKPVARVEPATFSNQEVEMAMSKIEQAGMDAKALISSRSSPMTPEKAAIQGKETTVRVSEPASVSSIVEKFERATGAGPAESEECTEGKASAQLPPEVCNQKSEDKHDIDNPADDDDVNQESGSDAGDEGEETESEDSPLLSRTQVSPKLPLSAIRRREKYRL
ncbi:Calponin homology domain-containing protein [Phytophthora infestans]|uniref:Calponin homology domain-containing protein n=1 Tax=Phytophthora infestans TaxID=4787 RepID=A0A833WIC9_PHYIN|nr:Calponin homology domain-containing protein [Phytophthora infestans]